MSLKCKQRAPALLQITIEEVLAVCQALEEQAPPLSLIP